MSDNGSEADAGSGDAGGPPLEEAELKQLRIRVMALENVLIALLAHATAEQLETVRLMSEHIVPRPGFTPHRSTLLAAEEIKSLISRSESFRPEPDRR